MAKIILITGTGLGKTFIGNAIEQVYTDSGVTCDRIFGSEPDDLDVIESSKSEYVIVESNYLDGKIDAWQTITVSGGQPDSSAK